MAMNNPYAAYQKYSKNFPIQSNKTKSGELAGDQQQTPQVQQKESNDTKQIQTVRPVNNAFAEKSKLNPPGYNMAGIRQNTAGTIQPLQQEALKNVVAKVQETAEEKKTETVARQATISVLQKPVHAEKDMAVEKSLPQVAQAAPVRQTTAKPAALEHTSPAVQAPSTSSTQAQYLENEVMTASPEKLTLMLYDGAIRFMNQAVIHITGKNIGKSNNSLIRAQDIFSELMITLNMDYGISKNLYNLYDFIKNSLAQANVKKDPKLIREMITMTRELRDTWSQAMQSVKKGK